MQQGNKQKLPIDAKLLSDAVIELNISRRSVSLYPPEHPIVVESIDRAFNYLQKLFEIRIEITLGIVKDTIVFDEYTLDKKNPVFQEFAVALHSRGLAAVSFTSGLSKEELIAFHSILTMKDSLSGKAFADLAKEKNIRHVILSPIDFSGIVFVEGAQRTGGTGREVMEDYVFYLLKGTLPTDAESALLNLPPEDMASLINTVMPEDSEEEAYDRVITGYLKRRRHIRLSKEYLDRFIPFIEGLKPEIKSQFLLRGTGYFKGDISEIESALTELSPASLEKISGLFRENSSIIPETLKNLIDKLTSIRKDKEFELYLLDKNTAVMDDIELDKDILTLFQEDRFTSFVNEDYQRELSKMLQSTAEGGHKLDGLKEECRDEVIDRFVIESMLELLETDFIKDEHYLNLITKLTEFINIFIETGRFEEILEVYNTLISHSLSGRFSHHASSMVEYYFRSEEFIAKLVDAIRLWGRQNRLGALRLARALKHSLIPPLLNSLIEESDASIRKFLLVTIGELGTDVAPYVVKWLNDDRWYIIRNMLYIVRESNARKYVDQIKKFAKHKKPEVCIEAVKTLLHFKTPDAVPFLKLYLKSNNTELRNKAVRLAGTYKVKGAVPYLNALLEKKDMFGTESYYKIDVVRALGEIGDRSSVDILIKIYRSKTFLYKDNLEQLKTEVFRNLDNYHLDYIRPLVELGLSSKNQEVSSISEKLIRQHNDSKEKGGTESDK